MIRERRRAGAGATAAADEVATTVERLYPLLASLERFDHRSKDSRLPADGLYFLFEKGETAIVHGAAFDRVVRVGSHGGAGGLPKRIRSHYGRPLSLAGNKNADVFRKLLGAAWLVQHRADAFILDTWLRPGNRTYLEVERGVSETARERFTFACIPMPGRDERLRLERRLVALLARHPAAPPSPDWLGRLCPDEGVAGSGLWCSQYLTSRPAGPQDIARLEEAAAGEGAAQR